MCGNWLYHVSAFEPVSVDVLFCFVFLGFAVRLPAHHHAVLHLRHHRNAGELGRGVHQRIL